MGVMAILPDEKMNETKSFCDWKLFNKHRFHHVNEIPKRTKARDLLSVDAMCSDTESL